MKSLVVVIIASCLIGILDWGCGPGRKPGEVRLVLVDSFSARRTYPVAPLGEGEETAVIGSNPVVTEGNFATVY